MRPRRGHGLGCEAVLAAGTHHDVEVRHVCSPAPVPSIDSTDRDAAHIVAFHPEQGWNLLCNGAIVFDDTGELLPDGSVVAPHRPVFGHLATAA